MRYPHPIALDAYRANPNQVARAPTPRCVTRTACRHHGGKSRRGPAKPRWQDGRLSMFAELLPDHMGQAFRALAGDGELLAMREDIALVNLRIMELMQ